jgi:hypothetical protein
MAAQNSLNVYVCVCMCMYVYDYVSSQIVCLLSGNYATFLAIITISRLSIPPVINFPRPPRQKKSMLWISC